MVTYLNDLISVGFILFFHPEIVWLVPTICDSYITSDINCGYYLLLVNDWLLHYFDLKLNHHSFSHIHNFLTSQWQNLIYYHLKIGFPFFLFCEQIACKGIRQENKKQGKHFAIRSQYCKSQNEIINSFVSYSRNVDKREIHGIPFVLAYLCVHLVNYLWLFILVL